MPWTFLYCQVEHQSRFRMRKRYALPKDNKRWERRNDIHLTVVTFSDRIIFVKIHMEVEKNLIIHSLKTTPLALCVPARGTAPVVT